MSASKHDRINADRSTSSSLRVILYAIGLLVLAMLAGCGGGSTSKNLPKTTPSPIPGGTAPTPVPTATPGPTVPIVPGPTATPTSGKNSPGTATPTPTPGPTLPIVPGPTATPTPNGGSSNRLESLGSVRSGSSFVYVGNAGDHSISGFQIDDSTGSLGQLSGSPFSTGPVADAALSTDPLGRFLYAAGGTMLSCSNLCSGGIAEFTIDGNGSLTEVAGSPLLTGSGFRGAQVHPSGGLFYAVDINLNQVFGFSIAASGALTLVPGSPFATGSMESNGIAIHGSGQFLYVANSSGNSISAFQINGSGTLFRVAESPFAAGGAESCPPSRGSIGCASGVATTGNFVYYVNGEAGENGTQEGNSVVGFSVNPTTGALTPLTGSPFANPGSVPQHLLTTPDGRFLYVANSGSNNVSAYSIDPANGTLTPVPGSPFTAGMYPLGMSTDPPGLFLYVTNVNSNSVSAYSIGPNGALTPVPGGPFASGSAPSGAAAAR